MPDKETLELYLDGSHGDVQVYFDIEKGEFVMVNSSSYGEGGVVNVKKNEI